MPLTIPFRNDSAASIPGFAVMRATGTIDVSGRLALTMDTPNATFERLYYINGPTPVPSGRFGQCRLLTGSDSLAYPILYAASGGTPEFGESWGPAEGEWALRPNRYGFTILGQPNGQRVFARQHEVCNVQGVLASDLFEHETATVHVIGGGASLGQQLLAHDALLPTNTHLPTGTPVVVTWLTGRWCVSGW